MKTIINNLFVLSCNEKCLLALAVHYGVSEGQMKDLSKSTKGMKKLRAIVGNKISQSPDVAAAYAAGTLTAEMLANAELNAAIEEADLAAVQAARDAMFAEADKMNVEWDAAHKAQTKAIKSAKDWLRELLSVDGASYTLADLVALTGKTEVNIRTMLSDLRSAKYAGKAGVFKTVSTRKDSKVYYSKAV